MKTKKTTEERYADELMVKLEERGAILTKADKRVVLQAFEKHFKEVHTQTLLRLTKK